MVITVLTLFPQMFSGPFKESIIARAQDKGLVKVNLINIRNFAQDKYKTVDDRPYGGGVGMILKVDVIDRALESVKSSTKGRTRTILLDTRGTSYNQLKARSLSKYETLILICGHYEGVDARVTKLVDEVVSVGNFVVTGGELPAMLVADSVVRLLPGVLQKAEATIMESFTGNYLEAPHYTRPGSYKGMKVPDVLLSGDHKKIQKWKSTMAKRVRTPRS